MSTESSKQLIYPRSANIAMTLDRMGSHHPTRLSFLRVLLRRLKKNNWHFHRSDFQINKEGVGFATYKTVSGTQSYTLLAFSHKLDDANRTDRVIANAWDATFTLIDGDATSEDIERLRNEVPRQESGRLSNRELVLSRANKSVRLFDYVVSCLAKGEQPELGEIEPIGYLMRTTAVYGSGKFGAADREQWAHRPEFTGSFQPEMLAVWLIRWFAIDLVEHMARQLNTKAAKLSPTIRRSLGIGNSTGLGMAPFLLNHPALLNSWVSAREEALARVRNLSTATEESIEVFHNRLKRSIKQIKQWHSEHPLQKNKLRSLNADMLMLHEHLSLFDWHQYQPWNALFVWSESNLSLEGQELLLSLLLEPHGSVIDDLSETMCAAEPHFNIDGSQTVAQTIALFEKLYHWTNKYDFSQPEATARVWYVSAQKLEPRLGERYEEEIEPYEQPLCPGRDADRAMKDMKKWPPGKSIAEFLLAYPEHRHIVRRAQLIKHLPYGEIKDNTIDASLLPIDLLRCKLAFFGAQKFDPRSDRWLRITMFQGAPYPDELSKLDPDDMAYPAVG
ncbi:MAG: hypothetical protein KTR18_13510 [Acidiferrobacterales bacterium]|nr:hypothetical protein [Acidiferrobacterales bacterium]